VGASNAGAPVLTNVLLSGNLLAGVQNNCQVQTGGTMSSGGHNLSNDATCVALLGGPGAQHSTTAGVTTALADNGGPTQTLALLAGSAAINAGSVGPAQPPISARFHGWESAISAPSSSAGPRLPLR